MSFLQNYHKVIWKVLLRYISYSLLLRYISYSPLIELAGILELFVESNFLWYSDLWNSGILWIVIVDILLVNMMWVFDTFTFLKLWLLNIFIIFTNTTDENCSHTRLVAYTSTKQRSIEYRRLDFEPWRQEVITIQYCAVESHIVHHNGIFF